ncbi:MAG: hypothetical protein AAGJ56_10845 [Myxococcota bacterium]
MPAYDSQDRIAEASKKAHTAGQRSIVAFQELQTLLESQSTDRNRSLARGDFGLMGLGLEHARAEDGYVTDERRV